MGGEGEGRATRAVSASAGCDGDDGDCSFSGRCEGHADRRQTAARAGPPPQALDVERSPSQAKHTPTPRKTPSSSPDLAAAPIGAPHNTASPPRPVQVQVQVHPLPHLRCPRCPLLTAHCPLQLHLSSSPPNRKLVPSAHARGTLAGAGSGAR